MEFIGEGGRKVKKGMSVREGGKEGRERKDNGKKKEGGDTRSVIKEYIIYSAVMYLRTRMLAPTQ